MKITGNKKEPLEKDTQRAICDYMYNAGYFFWRSNNIPVFGRNNGGEMTYRKLPKYTPRGLPDIIMVYKGKFIAWEVKRGTAKLRPEQAEFGVKCATHGGEYFIVNSVEQVKKYMDDLKLKLNIEKYES